MGATTVKDAHAADDSAELEPVRPFERLSRADVSYAGGKGANLGELTAAGVPVPGGFVVGAPSYAAFCDRGGLRKRIEGRLAELDVDDNEALGRAATEVREMVESEPIPPEVEAAIRESYKPIAGASGDEPVAVRSSATAEDTEAASFAGMNETFLNVRGADAVVDAVRRCWSSLFGARTVFYRAKRGFGQADMDIAVVVQRQVLSTRAGVMFTIDPASGAKDRLVIEGSFGLGEAVVSGSVSPDRYLVEKDDLAILAREVRRKELVIEPADGGGTVTRELDGEEAKRPVLSDEEVHEIAELGRRIEQHYGSPQDTEWCFDSDGKAFMLQSRPVTSAAWGGAWRRHGAGGRDPRPRPRRRPGHRLGTGARDSRTRRGRRPQQGRHPRHPHDRARLGATDAQGGGDRHRLRWDDLPRGDRLARARHPVRGRHRRGDHEAPQRRAGHCGRDPGRDREGAKAVARVAPAAAPAAIAAAPVTATKLLVNLSEPSQVERAAALDVEGVGLLRAELMVIEALEGRHPRLLIEEGRTEEFIERMAEALTKFAAGFHPRPITYRTIDFRTNEFRGLDGGERFEPEEANPMIGYRGRAALHART